MTEIRNRWWRESRTLVSLGSYSTPSTPARNTFQSSCVWAQCLLPGLHFVRDGQEPTSCVWKTTPSAVLLGCRTLDWKLPLHTFEQFLKCHTSLGFLSLKILLGLCNHSIFIWTFAQASFRVVGDQLRYAHSLVCLQFCGRTAPSTVTKPEREASSHFMQWQYRNG